MNVLVAAMEVMMSVIAVASPMGVFVPAINAVLTATAP